MTENAVACSSVSIETFTTAPVQRLGGRQRLQHLQGRNQRHDVLVEARREARMLTGLLAQYADGLTEGDEAAEALGHTSTAKPAPRPGRGRR